jgi:hypothetical protein
MLEKVSDYKNKRFMSLKNGFKGVEKINFFKNIV